jgi:hypothetical protein
MGCCAPPVSVENRGVQTPEPGAIYLRYRVDTSSLQVCFMVFTGVAYGGLKGAFHVHCWCKTHRDPVLKPRAVMQHNLGCFTLGKLHDMVGARGRKKYAPFVMCARVYINHPTLILNATLLPHNDRRCICARVAAIGEDHFFLHAVFILHCGWALCATALSGEGLH